MQLTKVLLVLTVFINSILCAAWDPASFHKEHVVATDFLKDEQFIKLKAQVTKALIGSWCSPEKTSLLMDLVLLTRPKVCVEIGVMNGSSVLPVAATLQHLNSGHLFAVDAWSNDEAIRHLAKDDPNRKWWSHLDMDAQNTLFKRMIKKWSLEDFCTTVAKTSTKAVDSVPEAIDLLHLDGDYSERGSLRDVAAYLPKVKSGGYIVLSNLYVMVNREQPKVKSFCALCEECNIICSIDNDNTILFKKM